MSDGAESAAVGAEAGRVVLLCTVRECRAPLEMGERRGVCPRGHAFDRARSGYWNLLQPQDRRSRNPGDGRAAALARRRLFAAGHDAPLLAAVREIFADAVARSDAAVLDIGCGEGSVLGALRAGFSFEPHGVDLSAAALELAARRTPGATWVVANADRFLPYADRSFDALLSLTSRRPAAEMARVLAPAGVVVVAVPGPDDLIELRAALQGEGRREDRWERVTAELAGSFSERALRRIRWQVDLDRAALADVLASSYRGARAAERGRLENLEGLAVTMSRDLGVFQAIG